MSEHPYRRQPSKAFWSRSVATSFDAVEVVDAPDILIRQSDRVASAGSCFASNLVPYLEQAGFAYVRTERPHPMFEPLPENLGYRNFSAAYGNIYTARQFLQLLDRATGRFVPAEDRWYSDGHVLDPFRPGLRYPARSDAEFDALTSQHLAAVRRAFELASVVVFTLGLTEAWWSTIDGAVYPACPGTVAGLFDAKLHAFHNFTVDEVRHDLRLIVARLRELRPSVRIILTVSPVPLVATATTHHVLYATTYSKSVLRVAAEETAAAERDVIYFPAYEIVTGPQAPHDYFEADRRNVSETGIRCVMKALLAKCETEAGATVGPLPPDGPVDDGRLGSLVKPAVAETRALASERGQASSLASQLSRLVAQAECDEALADS